MVASKTLMRKAEIFLDRTKNILARQLPPWVWRFRQKLKAQKALDLSVLKHLHSSSSEALGDIDHIEKTICFLGLCGENPRWELPSELKPYYGNGLLIWQYPCQFAPYLCKLKDYPIKSYMEIGVRHGGTFIATIEYLHRFNEIEEAIAIDLNDSPGIRQIMKERSEVEMHLLDSTSESFRKLLDAKSHIDLVLVDGGHDEATCRNDVDTVLSLSNIIVLHDISSVNHPDVGKVWRALQSEMALDFDFFSFEQQYESVKLASGGYSYFGIGMMVRKEWIKS